MAPRNSFPVLPVTRAMEIQVSALDLTRLLEYGGSAVEARRLVAAIQRDVAAIKQALEAPDPSVAA